MLPAAARCALSLLSLVVLLGAAPAPVATPSPTPERLLGLIRAKFRSHRPPPPFVTYTMIRAQKDTNGFIDYVGSYTYHIWTRTSDRNSLKRKVFRDIARGDMEFDRPTFNERTDPGPPTADVFEPAAARPRPNVVTPSPDPSASALPIIGTVTTIGEFDYRVVSSDIRGEQLHLVIEPTRDPERNRLREIFVDKNTLELQKLIGTDKLFVEHGPTYRAVITVTMGNVLGHLVVTDVHATIMDGYDDDGKDVDLHYKDIAFPQTLPDWYFNPKMYGAHLNDAPL